MNLPMTETLVAKGLQSQIAGLDLDHPHAREACLGLISALERSLDRIKSAEWDAEEAEIEAEWERKQIRDRAEKCAAAYPVVFDFGTYVRDIYNPMVKAMYQRGK